jgi:hypothetical protein
MSLFSRWFRKAPSPLPVTASAPPGPSAEERAQAAAAEQQALQAALQTGDVQTLTRLAVVGTTTTLRQAAAQAIDEPELLRELIREVRGGKDKQVYKILTAKRDAQLEQARQREALQAEIEAALAELEQHSQRAYDVFYAERLDQVARRWQTVAERADAEQRNRAVIAIDRARGTADEHLRQETERAATAEAAARAAAEAQRLREAEAEAEASAEKSAEQAPIPEAEQSAQEESPAPDQQAVRQIGEMIRKARAILGGGSTARAAALREAIAQAMQDAPPLPEKLLGQLQLLDQQLEEIKDWKQFSVAPKRAELIEEMEALIDAPLEPVALAEQIKALKDQWRTLSKGAGEHVEADTQRFEDAYQKAYQPCSEYFAAQKLIEKENLQRREAVLTRLSAFEADQDWAQADWRAVIKTLRDAKEEWRSISPVDRRAGKPQQERYSALIARVQDRVDAEHARNVQRKESLIQRAEGLLSQDDVRSAVDAVKKLQQEWQTVGPVPREVDQRLWGAFREHCDAVFQKRQQASEAFKAELERNKAEALALCEQVEAIAVLAGAELQERMRSLPELQTAFAALGELPREDAGGLRNRFDQALDRCRQALARERARAAEQSWRDLFAAADRVRAYGLALARGAGAEAIQVLREAATTFIASVPVWPKGGLELLERGLSGECSTDLAANERALRTLCIRAEILTELPTPPEDQALRRELQLQRLVQSLGQGVREDETQLEALALEWVAVGPVDEAVYAPLLQRFQRCRERDPTRA